MFTDVSQIQFSLHRADGRVHSQGAEDAVLSLVPCEEGCVKALHIDAVLKPNQPLFKVQSGFDPQRAVTLTLPLENTSFLSVYQHKDWWIRPSFPKSTAEIPDRTQLLLWKADGQYHALLAVTDKVYRSDISGSSDGICITLSSNRSREMSCNSLAAVYAVGNSPYTCCEAVVSYAMTAMKGEGYLRKNKTFPQQLEYLGWCTWDAFYQQVNEDGISQKLEEFKASNLPVGWILIDDGWSDADYKAQELRSFGTDIAKFPNGLAPIVNKAKTQYGIRHVGVWQAMMGYWNGIQAQSKAHLDNIQALTQLADGRIVPSPDNAFGFCNAWHTQVKSEGIDFVKVDEQSAPSLFFTGNHSYGQASKGAQDAMGASVGLHFGGGSINCMGMAPQELWHRSAAALVRSSDDYIPSAPNGFFEHCLQNTHTALLYSPIYWGDWDMFWSDEQNCQRHAMLRAVSGGPVYTSDPVGKTAPDVLLPIINKHGKVLRCDDVGLPTVDCLLTYDEGMPLKIFNRIGNTIVLAVFGGNAQATTKIGAENVGEACEISYLWYSHNGKVGVLAPHEALDVKVQPEVAELYLLIPKTHHCTPIGLTNKYISCALIESVRYFENRTVVTLSEGGIFAFHADATPKQVCVNGEDFAVTSGDAGLFTVDCSPAETPLIEIYFD